MQVKKFEILIADAGRPEMAFDAYGEKYIIPEHILQTTAGNMHYPCYAILTGENQSINVLKMDINGNVVTDDNGHAKKEYLSGKGIGHIFFTFQELKDWHQQTKELQSL